MTRGLAARHGFQFGNETISTHTCRLRLGPRMDGRAVHYKPLTINTRVITRWESDLGEG